jgi:hypothetical protein
VSKKRKLLVLVLVACVVGAGGVAAWYTMTPEPGVTAANFERLRPGMTPKQCESILGGPASLAVGSRLGLTLIWVGEAGSVSVFFSPELTAESGVVFDKDGKELRRCPLAPSLLDTIRRLLHL